MRRLLFSIVDSQVHFLRYDLYSCCYPLEELSDAGEANEQRETLGLGPRGKHQLIGLAYFARLQAKVHRKCILFPERYDEPFAFRLAAEKRQLAPTQACLP